MKALPRDATEWKPASQSTATYSVTLGSGSRSAIRTTFAVQKQGSTEQSFLWLPSEFECGAWW